MKKSKNIAVILAAGSGKRMGKTVLPKQFLSLSMKPIILLTLERTLKSDLFDQIILVVNKDWEEYTKQILCNYKISLDKLSIVIGGGERIDSLNSAVSLLESQNSHEDSIVVVLDAVRPFITKKILSDSIFYAKKYGVAVAGVEAKDTIYNIKENFVDDIPHRHLLINGQAPDSFKFKILKKSIDKMQDYEKKVITGTVQICYLQGYDVYVFNGDERNIKITTSIDYDIAKIIERGWKE
ncbi:IspD/TarI family cytidylyltransferase [Campylobacter coli]|nr:2-C-methyl-D-erythritol 4-phosphate cytidylyltransferase [Campylobacter coli]EAK1719753.1 2-C-methyl-D-erythritol 4-phosphate cytidylyltransferase [Campylobacter coli]EFY4358219.1 2-C-methyl-D-erythritol 4-phosphate cytidylyltransferase [Campylobacter coli]EHO0703064.1 2-C-methyl-D-erythritol 4-phosphate cytidylyltransferase [Campylobacter coli]